MDSQAIEIIGRNRLVTDLLLAGIEVAAPLRDRGIDLIAYLDLDEEIKRFVAIPIQMKAASTSTFSIDRKYDRFPNLVIAYVWGIGISHEVEPVIYAVTQSEAIQIATTMGYTETPSWTDNGAYTQTRPSQRLIELLEPFRMSPEAWRSKIKRLTEVSQPSGE